MSEADQEDNLAQISTNFIADDVLLLTCGGIWDIHQYRPQQEQLYQLIDSRDNLTNITFNFAHLEQWDSSLPSFLCKLVKFCAKKNIHIDLAPLPEELKQLVKLAEAVPVKQTQYHHAEPISVIESVGCSTINFFNELINAIEFLGKVVLAFIKLFTGHAKFQRSDFILHLQQNSIHAFGIVALITFLVGLIIAFIGGTQLSQFGAQMYVADLVAVGMLREMAPIMIGIIMAGRTGAAYAANIGTMKLNQEVDALQTMVLPPIEFLVLPRVFALVIMMPLLCIYGYVFGIFGGVVVGVGVLDISVVEYIEQTEGAITATLLLIGVIKTMVFSFIVSISGCYCGMSCARSAAAVGDAATSAVVIGIVMIIGVDGLFALILHILGI